MSDYEDPRWQQKRLRIMERDGWCCVSCGDMRSMLAVHHKVYRGRVWEALDDELQALCDACHAALGKHPKGGVWWAHRFAAGRMLPDAEPIRVVVVYHCPMCGSKSCDPCTCGWQASFAGCGTNWGTHREWPRAVVVEELGAITSKLKTQKLQANEQDILLNRMVELRRALQGIKA